MAIVNYDIDAPLETPTKQPTIQNPSLPDPVYVDTRYVPIDALATYVEGARYTVTYYSQVLARDTELHGHDSLNSTVIAPHRKIINFEILVAEALTGASDEETATVRVTGTATIVPPLVPNVGDMFIANIGDGNLGLFQITNLSRKSMNRDSVFGIEYELNCRVNTSPDRVKALEASVVKTEYYYRENLLIGKSPFILEEGAHSLRRLNALRGVIIQYYFDTFRSNEFATLIVPGQSSSTYDKFLIEYIMSIVTVMDATQLVDTKILCTDSMDVLSMPTIWTALKNQDPDGLPFANKIMFTLTTNLFSRIPQLESIRYSGISSMVFPLVTDISNLPMLGWVPELIDYFTPLDARVLDYGRMNEVSSQFGTTQTVLKNTDLTKSNITNLIKPVLIDDYYVFSKSFYDNEHDKSLLESLTLDYLHNKAIRGTDLLLVCEKFRYWGRLEQFYYIPVIITLIDYIMRVQ